MKKYQIIYADPPWNFSAWASGGNRHPKRHYSIMNTEAIKRLPIAGLADTDCFLFLWCPSPILPEGLQVIISWGFIYKTIAFTWVKLNKSGIGFFMGLGNWTRTNPESCLLGIKGKPKRLSKSVRQLLITPRQEHSRKPDEARDRIIRLCGDLFRIELFARKPDNVLFENDSWKGWNLWGNEVESDMEL